MITGYRQGKTMISKIMKVVHDLTEEAGYPPTLREISKQVGVGAPTVLYHIKRMEKLGLIKRDAGKSRSIRII